MTARGCYRITPGLLSIDLQVCYSSHLCGLSLHSSRPTIHGSHLMVLSPLVQVFHSLHVQVFISSLCWVHAYCCLMVYPIGWVAKKYKRMIGGVNKGQQRPNRKVINLLSNQIVPYFQIRKHGVAVSFKQLQFNCVRKGRMGINVLL